MSGVFSIHNAAPPLPATAWPTTMVAGGTLGRLANDHGGGCTSTSRRLGRRGAGNSPPAGHGAPTDLISYPSRQCSVPSATRHPTPTGSPQSWSHRSQNSLTKGKLNTVFRKQRVGDTPALCRNLRTGSGTPAMRTKEVHSDSAGDRRCLGSLGRARCAVAVC